MATCLDGEYWDLRPCLREPIPEIADAAHLLGEATEHHLAGRRNDAVKAIVAADKPIIRSWIESLWGSAKLYPDKPSYLRVRPVEALPPFLPQADRVPVRGPNRKAAQEVVARMGWLCAYCGNLLIGRDARKVLQLHYSEARWGRTNNERHNALMCLDIEFDHVVPHSRGGTNEIDNLVPCCAPCNCGKEGYTLEQLGLTDPRNREPKPSSWDGLTRLLA